MTPSHPSVRHTVRMGLFGRGARGSAGRAELARAREWIGARTGVEAYVEPATVTSSITVLLVAHDGEHTRVRVGSAREAADLARKAGIPVYDTNRVGVPQRKRDYDVRMARGGSDAGRTRSSTGHRGGTTTSTAPVGPSPTQQRAAETLARVAGVELVGHPGAEELARLLRKARANAHPDRRGGDRSDWDAVESAARTLDL